MNGRRLAALVRKESRQVVRDPSSLAIAFALPFILLLLFGYGVTLDPREVPVAAVVEQPGELADRFVSSFARSEWFEVTVLKHRRAAERGLVAGRYRAAVVLPQDFAARVRRDSGPAPIQVLLDGVDNNTARLVEGYIRGAWESWLVQTGLAGRHLARPPATLEPRVWYNQQVKSRNYLVPGLVAIIMTLIGTLLTALVVAREWERGTMETLMATPASPGELLVGKVVPYFVLGMGAMALSTAMAAGLFDIPLRGSLAVLAGVSALFLLAALGMGLFISTLARNQFVAGQIAILSAFLPAFILSGFIFHIPSMPAPIQALTYLVPARYFVAILHSQFLAGDVWAVLWPNLLGLVALAAVFLGATAYFTSKRLA